MFAPYLDLIKIAIVGIITIAAVLFGVKIYREGDKIAEQKQTIASQKITIDTTNDAIKKKDEAAKIADTVAATTAVAVAKDNAAISAIKEASDKKVYALIAKRDTRPAVINKTTGSPAVTPSAPYEKEYATAIISGLWDSYCVTNPQSTKCANTAKVTP